MVKLGRRRVVYRKTYRKSYNNYNRSYTPSYSRSRTSGRHRISKTNISKTYRIQKVSKILTTDVNITARRNDGTLDSGAIAVYNGSHLKASEIGANINPVYNELVSKLPTSMFSTAYNHLTYDSGIINPNLKLKNTKFTCAPTSLIGATIVSFHDPFISHFAFARDIQSLFKAQSLPVNYFDSLSVVVMLNGTITCGINADLPDDNTRTAFRTFVEANFAQLYEHYISCIISNDSKNIFKMIIAYDGNFRLLSLPIDQLVTNRQDLKREICKAALTAMGLVDNALETAVNQGVQAYSAAWDALYDGRYEHGYNGIQSACIGLTDNEKRIFRQWIASMLIFGLNNSRSNDYFNFYLENHRAGNLSAEATTANNAIAGAKLITIRHLYGDKPTLFEYTPGKTPNVIVFASHSQQLAVRIKQDYKFSSSVALRNIRRALYNNPDMTQYLSEGMRGYIDRAFPELRLYKAGQKAADRVRRLGRH